MKRVDAPSAWSSHSDIAKKEIDRRDPPEGVAQRIYYVEVDYIEVQMYRFQIVVIEDESSERL